jgi:hypothetical protein
LIRILLFSLIGEKRECESNDEGSQEGENLHEEEIARLPLLAKQMYHRHSRQSLVSMSFLKFNVVTLP